MLCACAYVCVFYLWKRQNDAVMLIKKYCLRKIKLSIHRIISLNWLASAITVKTLQTIRHIYRRRGVEGCGGGGGMMVIQYLPFEINKYLYFVPCLLPYLSIVVDQLPSRQNIIFWKLKFSKKFEWWHKWSYKTLNIQKIFTGRVDLYHICATHIIFVSKIFVVLVVMIRSSYFMRDRGGLWSYRRRWELEASGAVWRIGL